MTGDDSLAGDDTTRLFAEEPSGAADFIQQSSAEWLVRIDRDASMSTKQEFGTFLSTNPRHRAAFLRLAVAWRHADCLRGLAPLDGEVDVDLLSPRLPK